MNRFICSIIGIIGLFSVIGIVHAQQQSVVVLTSYPQEVVGRFEQAFEARYPQIRMDMVWHRSDDALKLVTAKPDHGVDVYWAPSRFGFMELARMGKLAQLQIDRTSLPGRVGDFPIDDPGNRYFGFEVAGFGFAINADYLTSHNIPVPVDWSDLAKPVYAGNVLLPVPSRHGFSPLMFEIILQSAGWEKGWSMLSQIAANAVLLDQGPMFLTEQVAAGKFGVGLTIDFFAKSATANGAPIKFVYARTAGFSPAHIAVLADAQHPDSARQFVEFMLSEEGQKLLLHPDVSRLPVRPSVYAGLDDAQYDPFDGNTTRAVAYDSILAVKREGTVSALFDVMISDRHAMLVEAWTKVRRAEQSAKLNQSLLIKLEQARKFLEIPPITETEAQSEGLISLFPESGRKRETAESKQLYDAWALTLDNHYQQAVSIADEIIRTVGE